MIRTSSQLPDPYWVSDDGTVTLYCGDCLAILPHLSGVDAVVTDPPYGDDDTHKGHLSSVTMRDGTPAGRELGFAGISSAVFVDLMLELCKVAARWVVATCEWKYMADLDKSGCLVRFGIWRKPDGAPQFTGDRPGTGWEAVAICHRPGRKWWNGGGSHAFWDHPKSSTQNSDHPTQKPYRLLRDFVRQFSDDGETILDPFMGSGTTGVACVRTGRKFIGIEIEEKYCAIAKRRIQEAFADQALFAGVQP